MMKESRYKILKPLAEGQGNTNIFIAFDKLCHENVVCKVFSRDGIDFLSVEEEIRIQEYVNHPNIAPIKDVVYEKENIFVIMKLYQQGDLLGILQRQVVGTKNLIKIYSNIVDAVAYLHERGIAHLDIKPENIFIDENFNPVLADFGCCETEESRKRPYQPRGTIMYAAPEILDENIKDHRPMDIWSLGILMYLMITHHLPWKKGDDNEILQQVIKGDIGPTDELPRTYMKIVTGCCKKNPKERLSIHELRDILEEKFPSIVEYNVQKRHSSSELVKKYQKSIIVKPRLEDRSSKDIISMIQSTGRGIKIVRKIPICQQSQQIQIRRKPF